jgi:hypothetical protein
MVLRTAAVLRTAIPDLFLLEKRPTIARLDVSLRHE